MIYIIIGHRGSGKTSFLQNLKRQYKRCPKGQTTKFFDLDQEVVKETKMSIKILFEAKGEKEFRFLEKKVFYKIYKKLITQITQSKNNFLAFISVGAGFKVPRLKFIEILWIQRLTDSEGRIFLDRPRLSVKEKDPLKESLSFYSKRNKYFEKIAHQKLLIPEGFQKNSSPLIRSLFKNKMSKSLEMKGALTLQKELFFSKDYFKKWIQKRMHWNISFFEIRDDLLSTQQIALSLKQIPKERIIFSFRKKGHPFSRKKNFFEFLLKNKILWDWPIEEALPPLGNPPILSLHERKKNESVKKCTLKFEKFLKNFQSPEDINQGNNQHERNTALKKQKRLNLLSDQKREPYLPYLKLSIFISNFEELWKGHLWWLKDPKRRSFLPRSSNGDWSWYRLIHKEKMKINFFRESLPKLPIHPSGQAKNHSHQSLQNIDQPLAVEWIYTPSSWKYFLALLGDPIHHSLTPWIQNKFSKKYSIPIVKIPLPKKRCTKKTLEILKNLNLIGAAVTSPLKEKMYSYCETVSRRAFWLRSVNTLSFKKGKKNKLFLKGDNTDTYALQCLSKALLSKKKAGQKKYKKIGVWGGGGVLTSIKKAFPSALFFSSRSGKLKVKTQLKVSDFSPDLLIWAAGQKSKIVFPPSHWKPKLILDLNYIESSFGKKYAQTFNLPYQSGLEMFKLQAKNQRQVWEKEIFKQS